MSAFPSGMIAPSPPGSQISVSPPRGVIRIAATGHRPNRLPPDWRPLRDQCRAAILAIVAAAHAAARNRLPLRVISAMAEGADRIIADAGLALGAEMLCLLPFCATEYEKDFATAGSRAEFRALIARAAGVTELPGVRADADAAYEAVGRAVIADSDIVIAIWDGGAAAGRGGTAQIVAEALARRMPVVHIPAANAAGVRLLVQSGPQPSGYPLEHLQTLWSRGTDVGAAHV